MERPALNGVRMLDAQVFGELLGLGRCDLVRLWAAGII